MKINLADNLTFGFEQTFTIEDWWTDPGFTATSDTPKKREKMLEFSIALADELNGKYFESLDIWKHMQYEVTDKSGVTQFFVTMDPGSIEVKSPPCLIKDVEKMAAPLFIAAKKANVVAYRNWWYGVKGGTEGGCHVNMGGFTEETNPLKNNPSLVVKYASYIHNRPWLHFPFMGLDVGPGGNAMRMDEKENFSLVKETFTNYIDLSHQQKTLTPMETYRFFEKTNLIADKSSYPSLYKFKDGLFLIEDRGQESLRSARDFYLVSLIRLKIFEYLEKTDVPESLQTFENIHSDYLTSIFLWEKFEVWANEMGLPTEEFKVFFERQFPILCSGQNIPKNIFINDGRRPRVITDIQKRGDVVISKTIDTTQKRFEVYTHLSDNIDFKIEADGIQHISKKYNINGVQLHYIDLKYNPEKPEISIQISKDKQVLESCVFNAKNMMWE